MEDQPHSRRLRTAVKRHEWAAAVLRRTPRTSREAPQERHISAQGARNATVCSAENECHRFRARCAQVGRWQWENPQRDAGWKTPDGHSRVDVAGVLQRRQHIAVDGALEIEEGID